MNELIITPKSIVIQIEKLLIDEICAFIGKKNSHLSKDELQFLCEPWIHFFTHSIIHRLEITQEKASFGKNLTSPSKHCVPGDTIAFLEFLRSSHYSKFIDDILLGINTEPKCRSEIFLLNSRLPFLAKTVCFKPCFPRNFRYSLNFFSLGRIGFLHNKYRPEIIDVDWSARKELEDSVTSVLHNIYPKFAHQIANFVSRLFPKSLLENLPENFKKKSKDKKRNALYSADGWHTDDDWKIYALAQKKIHKTHWIGAPNAISHGSLAIFWQREFELKMLDFYLTWGWNTEENKSKITPFYSPHFAGLEQERPVHTTNNSGILITTAARPLHTLEYPYTPERFKNYLKTQMSLAKQIQIKTNELISIRTRPNDLGWNLIEMVRNLDSKYINLEFQNGKFKNRLAKCKLHICDNCSTTIAESFWANHPTLIIITNDYFQVHPNSSIEYKKLFNAGIFHKSIDSLLDQLDRIINNLDQWWTSAEVQSAISFYLNRQAKAGGSLLEWKKALSKS